MKKTTAILTVFITVMTCLIAPGFGAGETASDAAAQDTPEAISTPAPVTLGGLITHLVHAFESEKRVEEDVKALDSEVARSVAEHWKKVYLNADYRLYLYGKDDPSSLPIAGAHAFAVLGYELADGEMTDELKGRCEAAAAAARAFPSSILVCSGGATGANNPEGHTEAGLMRDYLIDACGIAPERIFIDERAMTTSENAVNTLEILREQGIETMTLVTSAYHQRRAQVMYNAVAAQNRQKYGSAPEIVANFCLDIETANPMLQQDALLAAIQLGSILELPPEQMQELFAMMGVSGRPKKQDRPPEAAPSAAPGEAARSE